LTSSSALPRCKRQSWQGFSRYVWQQLLQVQGNIDNSKTAVLGVGGPACEQKLMADAVLKLNI
jgi:hypothetical protein